MSEAIVQLRDVGRSFGDGHQRRQVLEHIDLELKPGDRIAVLGPSGSGKSTLLNIVAGLDHPDTGTVMRSGLEMDASDEAMARWRNAHIGFIFQEHHLLPQCTVLENILLPRCAFGSVSDADRQRAQSLLAAVQLADRADSWPAVLSGGERQRVAVLRALIMEPSVLLADEPTGALDADNAEQVAVMLDELQQAASCALLLVTHHQQLAARMDQQLELRQSQLQPL